MERNQQASDQVVAQLHKEIEVKEAELREVWELVDAMQNRIDELSGNAGK